MDACCRKDPKIIIPIKIGTKPIWNLHRTDSWNAHIASGSQPSAPPPQPIMAPITVQPTAPALNTISNGEKSDDSAPAYPHDGEC